MPSSLFDRNGVRKYLTARERLAFVYAASNETEAVSTFCLTLAFTGARISEVLALTINRVDAADEAIIFETLTLVSKPRKSMRVPSETRNATSLGVLGVLSNLRFRSAKPF